MSETKKPEAFFDKVVFGGYDTVQVDEFVIEAKKIIAQYKKDNALLTQKLKILADEINAGRSANSEKPVKIEELRQAEPNPEKETVVEAEPVKAQDTAAEKSVESLISLNAELSKRLMEQYQAQSEALRNGLEKMEKMLETAGKACDVIGSILTSAEARRESLGTSADQTPPSVKAEPAPEQVSKDEPGGEDVVASVFDGVKDDAAEDKDAWDSKEETAQAGQPESAGSDQVFYVTRVDDAEENSGDTAEKEPEPEKETIAEVKSEPEPKPVESAAENVAPGESVTLDSDGIDTSNLTYEEALALVLSKNGIKYRSTGFQTASDDNEKTKEFKTNMASVEQIKPGKSAKKDEAGAAEKKQKKEKKPGLVSLIKQGINAILEDEDDEDDDDDSLDPSIFDEIKASEQPLQFGKDYDVKKKN